MIDVYKQFAEPRRMLLEITYGFEEKKDKVNLTADLTS